MNKRACQRGKKKGALHQNRKGGKKQQMTCSRGVSGEYEALRLVLKEKGERDCLNKRGKEGAPDAISTREELVFSHIGKVSRFGKGGTAIILHRGKGSGKFNRCGRDQIAGSVV